MEKLTAPYVDHPGAISDEEAMTIQTSIDNFRATGFHAAADLLDHAAWKRLKIYGVGDVVPTQPSFREIFVA